MGHKKSSFQKLMTRRGREKVKFTKAEYQLSLPFAIYADFKSILCKQNSCEPSSSKYFTTQYQNHVPCGNCIYVKCNDGKYFEPLQVNMGKFLDQVLVAAICRQHPANKIFMKRLTLEQWNEYKNTMNFSICIK